MAGLFAKLYNFSPVWVQNIGVSIYGWQWQKRRFGGAFEQELVGFKNREAYSVQQWHDYQTIQLRKLLVHAFENVPYYREKYGYMGFNIQHFRRFEIEDLPKLPCLSKEDLRQFGTNKLLSDVREKGGAFFSSSGSTGTPTQILFSTPFHQRWSAAFEARIRHWAGVDRFTSRGMIGGRRVVPEGFATPPFYRYNLFEKQVYFSAYHINQKSAKNYREGIHKYELEYMTGYAMSNYFLARFFKEEKLNIHPLKAVITSSEKLTPEMRSVFQEVYGCKTYDSYSGVEACGLISETSKGQLLINPDVGVTEVIRLDGTYASSGNSGEIIATGLLNYDQPLIRYRIGDEIQLSVNQRTICGRNMPVVNEIIGRIEDTVIGPDGREMVRFHGLFVNLPNVKKGQVIQHELMKFELTIETDKGLSLEEKTIISQRMKSQLGNVEINIREVKEIPLTANGKFKAVISHIKRPVNI